jgi:hypothetical protein
MSSVCISASETLVPFSYIRSWRAHGFGRFRSDGLHCGCSIGEEMSAPAWSQPHTRAVGASLAAYAELGITVGRKRLSFTAARAICARSNFCSAIPRWIMSRVGLCPVCQTVRFDSKLGHSVTGHSPSCHRLWRKAMSLSSGRYLPGFPFSGLTASRTRCFSSRSASK